MELITEVKATDYKGFEIFERTHKEMRDFNGVMKPVVWTDYLVKNAAGELCGCSYFEMKTAKAQCTKMVKREVEKHDYMK